MSIFINRIISNAYMSMYKKKSPIRESYTYIYESAIDTKVNNLAKEIAKENFVYDSPVTDATGKPQKYASGNPMKYDRVYIKHLVGEKIPFSKDKNSNAKFFLGALRIFGDILKNSHTEEEISNQCLSLNKILGIIVHDSNHINEYDNNLNGKTLKELEETFGKKVKDLSAKEKEEINSKEYTRNEKYTITPCNTWADMLQFGEISPKTGEPLTTWCVAQEDGKHAYDSYTDSGLCKFYVCTRHGYEELKAVPGENPPLDDYGLSMIAVCVDQEGNLKTCTCRWNHMNGGNDNIMDAKQISDLLGVNFFETFKPIDSEKIFNNLKYDEYNNPLCIKLKLRYDDDDNYYRLDDNKKIIKYKVCYKDSLIACLANKNFEWYELKSGQKINPPDSIDGDFSCSNCNSLTSLKGAPYKVNGYFNCAFCDNLTSLKGAPSYVGGNFYCHGCDNLTSLGGGNNKVGGGFYCIHCNKLTTLKGAPSEVGGDFCCNMCENLTSLEGAPVKVGKCFHCDECKNLISLEGAPITVVEDFECSFCDKLTSLKGAPKKVGGSFDCIGCKSLTSLVGAPPEIGGYLHCHECYMLPLIKDAPESIRNKILWQ